MVSHADSAAGTLFVMEKSKTLWQSIQNWQRKKLKRQCMNATVAAFEAVEVERRLQAESRQLLLDFRRQERGALRFLKKGAKKTGRKTAKRGRKMAKKRSR